jgi:hypothetical protein
MNSWPDLETLKTLYNISNLNLTGYSTIVTNLTAVQNILTLNYGNEVKKI